MPELMGAADRARRVLSRVGDPGPGGDGGDAVIEHRPAGAESERRVAGPLEARVAGQCYGPKSHAGGRIEAGVEAPPAAARVMMPADGSRDRGEPAGDDGAMAAPGDAVADARLPDGAMRERSAGHPGPDREREPALPGRETAPPRTAVRDPGRAQAAAARAAAAAGGGAVRNHDGGDECCQERDPLHRRDPSRARTPMPSERVLSRRAQEEADLRRRLSDGEAALDGVVKR